MAFFDQAVLINAAQVDVAAHVRASAGSNDNLDELRTDTLIIIESGWLSFVYLLGTQTGKTKLRLWIETAAVVKAAFDGRPLGESIKVIDAAQTRIPPERQRQIEQGAEKLLARLQGLGDPMVGYSPPSASKRKTSDRVETVKESKSKRLIPLFAALAIGLVLWAVVRSGVLDSVDMAALIAYPVPLDHDLLTLSYPSNWTTTPAESVAECDNRDNGECLILLEHEYHASMAIIHYEHFNPPLTEREMARRMDMSTLSATLIPALTEQGILLSSPTMVQVGGYNAFAVNTSFEDDESVGWYYLVVTPTDFYGIEVTFANVNLRTQYADDARDVLQSIRFKSFTGQSQV